MLGSASDGRHGMELIRSCVHECCSILQECNETKSRLQVHLRFDGLDEVPFEPAVLSDLKGSINSGCQQDVV